MALDIVLHRADTHSVSPQPPKKQETVWGQFLLSANPQKFIDIMRISWVGEERNPHSEEREEACVHHLETKPSHKLSLI